MATATAGDLINGALRLLGVLAEGETPSAATSQDALTAFDQMIDSWNIERLSVYATFDQTFTWPANTITTTLGPTGNFVGERPVSLDLATYFVDVQNNLSFGIKFINEDQYNNIALKNVTSTYPQVIWVNDAFPNISMKIYPKPIKDLEWHFISVKKLVEPASLTTEISLPPGYLRAFRFNLACEIAAEFGIEPPNRVVRLADVSKRNLKRINDPGDILSMPYPVIVSRPRYNIYTNAPT